MLEKLKKILTSRYTLLIALIAILGLSVSIYIGHLYKRVQNATNEAKKIYELTQQQAQDITYLQNQLQISKGEAHHLADKINQAQAGTMQPITHITVQTPDLPAATKIVSEKIIERDKSLPSEALRKSDSTIVTPQPDNKNYKVGIYKINLKRNWYRHQMPRRQAIYPSITTAQL